MFALEVGSNQCRSPQTRTCRHGTVTFRAELLLSDLSTGLVHTSGLPAGACYAYTVKLQTSVPWEAVGRNSSGRFTGGSSTLEDLLTKC